MQSQQTQNKTQPPLTTNKQTQQLNTQTTQSINYHNTPIKINISKPKQSQAITKVRQTESNSY